MSPLDYYKHALQNYGMFSGRDTRSQFWYFVLVNIIIYIVLYIVYSPAAGLYNLALIVPSLAAGARRLHDTGRTGWWQLISLVPLIGLIILIIFWVEETHPTKNLYGEVPKK